MIKTVHALREALEETGIRWIMLQFSLKAMIHSGRDTPANHRDGQWLATTLEKLGITKLHNRGIHYAVIGQIKPNGKPLNLMASHTLPPMRIGTGFANMP
jgi:hypothetical protein